MLLKRLKGIKSLFQQLSNFPFGSITCKNLFLLTTFLPAMYFSLLCLHFVLFYFYKDIAFKMGSPFHFISNQNNLKTNQILTIHIRFIFRVKWFSKQYHFLYWCKDLNDYFMKKWVLGYSFLRWVIPFPDKFGMFNVYYILVFKA